MSESGPTEVSISLKYKKLSLVVNWLLWHYGDWEICIFDSEIVCDILVMILLLWSKGIRLVSAC